MRTFASTRSSDQPASLHVPRKAGDLDHLLFVPLPVRGHSPDGSSSEDSIDCSEVVLVAVVGLAQNHTPKSILLEAFCLRCCLAVGCVLELAVPTGCRNTATSANRNTVPTCAVPKQSSKLVLPLVRMW